MQDTCWHAHTPIRSSTDNMLHVECFSSQIGSDHFFVLIAFENDFHCFPCLFIWLVVWNIFYFSIYWNNHPNWLIFFRGIETPTSHGCSLLFCMFFFSLRRWSSFRQERQKLLEETEKLQAAREQQTGEAQESLAAETLLVDDFTLWLFIATDNHLEHLLDIFLSTLGAMFKNIQKSPQLEHPKTLQHISYIYIYIIYTSIMVYWHKCGVSGCSKCGTPKFWKTWCSKWLSVIINGLQTGIAIFFK